MIEYTSCDTIMKTTNRLAFEPNEISGLVEYLKICRNKGRDLSLPEMIGDTQSALNELLSEGLIVLCSSHMLETDFMFVKVNAGKGVFGRQKAHYNSFVGSAKADEWMPGASFKSFIRAYTSITNLYNAQGFN